MGVSKQAEAVKSSMRRKSALLRQFKSEVGCSRCGESHPACLDFHHLDPSNKHYALSKRYKHGGTRRGGNNWGAMGYADILKEIEGCEVVCANCHRKEGFETWRGELVPPDRWTKQLRWFMEELERLKSLRRQNALRP